MHVSYASTKAVLFDRDGTLIADVPGNRDPKRIAVLPGAREAVRALRACGCAIGVITNQPAVDGAPSDLELARIHRRIDALIGIDAWFVCRHVPGAGCACRKPMPGLIAAAARHFGVMARDCVIVGDIGSDMEAASAAGARGILVPTVSTLPEEVAAASTVAEDVLKAAHRIVAALK